MWHGFWRAFWHGNLNCVYHTPAIKVLRTNFLTIILYKRQYWNFQNWYLKLNTGGREGEIARCMHEMCASSHLVHHYVNIKLTRSGTINRKTFILLPKIPFAYSNFNPTNDFTIAKKTLYEFNASRITVRILNLSNIVRHCVWMCNGEVNFMVAPKVCLSKHLVITIRV